MAGKISAKSARVAYVAEVTPGVTPATPAFKVFRSTGEGVEVIRQLSFTSELNGKRGQNAHSLARKGGRASYNFKFSYATLDDFLESALRSAWTTDALIDGVAQKTFTLETMFEGGATDIYKRVTGSEVNNLSLSFKAGEDISGSVAFMGLDGDFYNAAIASSTYVAANTNPIQNFGDFSAFTMSGLTVGCVSAIDLTINNNLSEIMCLGSLAPTDLDGSATLEVTGSIAIALTSDEYDVLRAGADATTTSLDFKFGRTGGSKMRIELPNIVLSDINPKAEDADSGTVLINATFRAMQSSTLSGGVIRVTRAVA